MLALIGIVVAVALCLRFVAGLRGAIRPAVEAAQPVSSRSPILTMAVRG